MRDARQQGLKFTESLLLALPFVALLLLYALVTGKADLKYWPPHLEMGLSFWWPVIFSTCVYGLLLLNLGAKRKENWRLGELLVTIVVMALFWYIMAPEYEASMGRAERHKVPRTHSAP